MRDFVDEPVRVLNPADGQFTADSDISMSLEESLITEFRYLDYEMVFFRLPDWCAQVEMVIRSSWDSLRPGGRFCVYADINDYTNLEALLGRRTTQVPVTDYDEMIFIWVK